MLATGHNVESEPTLWATLQDLFDYPVKGTIIKILTLASFHHGSILINCRRFFLILIIQIHPEMSLKAVLRCGPQRRISLCAMAHYAELLLTY